MNNSRWKAVVEYRSDNGPIGIEHNFEEMLELHDIVERGPDWNSIIKITIVLDRVKHVNLTVEGAMSL